MKKSIYNYHLLYKGNRHIIFNTFNTSLIILDDEHYNKYLSLDCSSFDEEMVKVLRNNGMLIDDIIDEKSIVDFDRGQAAYATKSYFYRILTTTACNAHCGYCYEQGAKLSTMSLDTAKQVVEYIERTSANASEFILGWFGGEPLLNPDVIDFISCSMHDYAKTSGKKWWASIITNASLFSNELIQKASTHWNVKKVQVTLDGTKEKYESIKAYTDGSKFESVINAIKQLVDQELSISIRLNFNESNYNDIQKLILYLGENLDTSKDNWSIYPYPLFDNTREESDPAVIKLTMELERLIFNITGKSDTNGITLPKYLSGRCRACSVSGDTIMPDGSLIKCSRYMNLGESFGHVSNSIVKYSSEYTKWCTPTLPPKCEKCTLLPICQGGCRAEQFMGKKGCTIKARNIDAILTAYADTYSKA